MEPQSALRTIQDVAEFTHEIGARPKIHYTTFTIPKRSGGIRTIHSPAGPLASVQRRIANLLTALYSAPGSTHGFAPKRSIITNALSHCGSTHFLNLDIRDCFPSISEQMVAQGLATIGADSAVIDRILRICMRNGSLPQGSPTSPILLNLALSEFDRELSQFASANGAVVSRYADDITISTASKMPSTIAVPIRAPFRVLVGRELSSIFANARLAVNFRKLRLEETSTRAPLVTGIHVAPRLDVRRRVWRRTEAMFRMLRTFGAEQCEASHAQRFGGTFHSVLAGLVEFISSVVGPGDVRMRKLLDPSDQRTEADFWSSRLAGMQARTPKLREMAPRPGETVFFRDSDGGVQVGVTARADRQLQINAPKPPLPTSIVIDARGHALGRGSDFRLAPSS
ncbi:MAG: reverse transcriptase family protein [Archangium sp.]